MSLFLQVADNAVTTQVALAEYFLDFRQVLLSQRHLEQVVCVVDLVHLHVSLSVECVHLVLHEL